MSGIRQFTDLSAVPANALRGMGLDAHVVEFAPRLMPVQLDEGGARILRRKVESLGVKVMPETSLATDKKIYPRGGLVVVDTQAIQLDMGKNRFLRYMLDQDTGGAIQAPGRADIYMGWDPGAEIVAGGQYAEGKLFYLFLKPQFVDQYLPATAPNRRVASRN